MVLQMPRPLALLLSLLCCLAAVDEPGEFTIRPALPLNQPALAALRQLVKADSEATALAAAVAAMAAPLSSNEPQPLPVIRYEGLVNTHPERLATVAKLRSMDDVALLLQHWQASGDAVAAATLVRHIAAWSATYQPTGNDVNENKLTPLLVAWHALRPQADQELRSRVDAWVVDLGTRHARAVGESRELTNRYTKHVRLAVYCGLAIGRQEWVALGREGIERFVASSLRANGGSLDLERRDSLTYHCSALVPALDLAQILGPEGRRLYAWTAPSGGSLRASVDFVVPYATGERRRKEWVNSTVELDRQRAAAGLEKYGAGREFEPAQAADLMEAASAFDARLVPVWNRLAGVTAKRFGSWRMLAQAACLAAK